VVHAGEGLLMNEKGKGKKVVDLAGEGWGSTFLLPEGGRRSNVKYVRGRSSRGWGGGGRWPLEEDRGGRGGGASAKGSTNILRKPEGDFKGGGGNSLASILWINESFSDEGRGGENWNDVLMGVKRG